MAGTIPMKTHHRPQRLQGQQRMHWLTAVAHQRLELIVTNIVFAAGVQQACICCTMRGYGTLCVHASANEMAVQRLDNVRCSCFGISLRLAVFHVKSLKGLAFLQTGINSLHYDSEEKMLCIEQGPTNMFVRGPHMLLHNSSRAGHLT